MATVNGTEYDHIAITQGSTTTKHMLKDATARGDIENLKSAIDYFDGKVIAFHVNAGAVHSSTADQIYIDIPSGDNYLLSFERNYTNTLEFYAYDENGTGTKIVAFGGLKKGILLLTASIDIVKIGMTVSANASADDYLFSVSKAQANTYSMIDNRIGKINLVDLFEIGVINISNTGWTYSQGNKRVRTKYGTTLHLYPGNIVGLSDYTNARFFTGYKKSDGTYGTYSWRTSNLVIENEGDYVFQIANNTDVVQSSYTTLASLFFGYSGVAYDSIRENEVNIKELKELHSVLYSGYLNASGNVATDNNTVYKAVTTDFIPVEINDTFKIDFSFASEKEMWIAYCYYDDNKNLVGSRTAVISAVNYTSGNARIDVSNENARYIRISYRTYGEINISLKASNPIKINAMRIEDINTNNVIGRALINDNVKSINHRGYATFPENTLPAFTESREKGFVIVETDVRFTSDNIPVLLHDETINRTARNADGTEISGTVNIADITYAQSQEYDFGIYKGSEFAGIKIPKFEDFLKLCRALGLGCYIELKTGTQEQLEHLVEMVKDNGMKYNTTWISGSPTRLTIVKNKDAKTRLGYITNSFSSSSVTFLQELETTQNYVFADLSISAADFADQISLAKENDIPVEVWTVTNTTEILNADPYVTGMTADSLIAGYVLYDNAMKAI